MSRRSLGLCLACLMLPLSNFGLWATLKYKRETGKRCTFCHVTVPRKGSRDPRLNEEGRKFMKNNYKLTEEQKKKPVNSP